MAADGFERVVLASGNAGKLRELQTLLADWPHALVSQAEFDVPDEPPFFFFFFEGVVPTASSGDSSTTTVAVRPSRARAPATDARSAPLTTPVVVEPFVVIAS